MTRVKRLLVPLDGSLLAETILPVATAWAKADDAEVVLLRATPSDRPAARDSSGTHSQHAEENYLAQVADRLKHCGVTDVRTVVCYDVPDRAIVDAAHREEIDLIAIRAGRLCSSAPWRRRCCVRAMSRCS